MRSTNPAILTALTLAASLCSQSLTTTFAADNSGQPNWSNYFDLTVRNPITLLALDVNLDSLSPGMTGSVDIYMTPAGVSFVGNEAAPIWTLAAEGIETEAQQLSVRTTVCLATALPVAVGSYGVAIHYRGAFRPAYTNGTGRNGNQTYLNNDLTLITGSATSDAPGTPGAMRFSPRVWNGSLHYGDFACARSVGQGCGNNGPGVVYEHFDGVSSSFDFPQGSGWRLQHKQGGYRVTEGSPNSRIVPPSSPRLNSGSNFTQRVLLPRPMPVGASFVTAVFVCSNGWVALEPTASASPDDNVSDLLAGPSRICALWTALDATTRSGGSIHAESEIGNPNMFHVTWLGIREASTAVLNQNPRNTVQVSFDTRNGDVEVKYDAVAVRSCTIGYSNGNGVFDPGPTDMSAANLDVVTRAGDRDDLRLDSGRPIARLNAQITLTSVPAGAVSGALLFGFNGLSPAVDLTSIGMPNCVLTTSGTIALPIPVNAPNISTSLGLGDTAGANLFLQAAIIAPGVNQLGALTSNGLEWNIATR